MSSLAIELGGIYAPSASDTPVLKEASDIGRQIDALNNPTAPQMPRTSEQLRRQYLYEESTNSLATVTVFGALAGVIEAYGVHGVPARGVVALAGLKACHWVYSGYQADRDAIIEKYPVPTPDPLEVLGRDIGLPIE